MTLVIKIEDDGNSAFADGKARSEHVSILKKVTKQIEVGRTYGLIHDSNGNKVGEWTLDLPEPIFTMDDLDEFEDYITISMFCEETTIKVTFDIFADELKGMTTQEAKDFVFDKVDVPTDESIVGSRGNAQIIEWINNQL